MSDTPRTASVATICASIPQGQAVIVLLEHAAQLERELAEANANAPWLSAAHALCTDAGIPPGHISERIEALRGVIDGLRVDAERLNYLESLRERSLKRGFHWDQWVYKTAGDIRSQIDGAIEIDTAIAEEPK